MAQNPQHGMFPHPSKRCGTIAYPDCMQTAMHAREALMPQRGNARMLCSLEPNKMVPKPAPMATYEDDKDRSEVQEEPH
jgi:hypothetical protein